MALTLRTWIQKSVEIANRGLDPNSSPMLDAEGMAEPMAANVMADLAEEYVADGRSALLPRQAVSLTFVNGVATIPDEVIEGLLDTSVLADPADNTKEYSYISEWGDFIRVYDRRIGYYTVPSFGSMRLIQVGTVYNPITGPAAALSLTTPCYWTIPLDPDADMAVPSEIETDLIAKLAAALAGTIPLDKGAE